MNVDITNICAKFSTGCVLDLDEILNNEHYYILNYKKYKKNVFSALIAKYNELKLTFLIFSNGNIIITGAKSVKECENAIYDLVFTLNLIGPYSASILNYCVTNYCAKINMGKHVNFEKLCSSEDQAEYTPEIFISVKYKINNRNLTVTRKGIIFGVGFKTPEEANDCLTIAYNRVKPYLIN